MNNQINSGEQENKGNQKATIIFLIIVLIAAVIFCVYYLIKGEKLTDISNKDTNQELTIPNYLSNGILSNSLDNFDIYFLTQNNKENMVYSPLSIKYALEMLSAGANGTTKEQITKMIGNYRSNNYINSSNMSFANVLFVKDSYKNNIKDSYVNALKDNYNAEVVYDSFATASNLNAWVKNRTFNLIDNLYDDISNQNFILTNALAIDMEWNNKIQSEDNIYYVEYPHENYDKYVGSLDVSDYTGIDFENVETKSKAAEISATINKYDIVKTLGESKIKETVKNEYDKWLANGAVTACSDEDLIKDMDTYLSKYITEIGSGYNSVNSSTDFSFYVDDDVKVFAKDLKEYNGTKLQYVGIMPTKITLDSYTKNTNAENISKLIDNLKTIELSNFKEGVITEITGYIPMFKFEYKMDLLKNLKSLGITDVFDSNKADLSNITTDSAVINSASHKTNIEFSNSGIKAAAATELGGFGGGDCGFDYKFDVPVEKIDLTFNKPYVFIIRDSETGEVWFTGSVYEPIEYVKNNMR